MVCCLKLEAAGHIAFVMACERKKYLTVINRIFHSMLLNIEILNLLPKMVQCAEEPHIFYHFRQFVEYLKLQ